MDSVREEVTQRHGTKFPTIEELLGTTPDMPIEITTIQEGYMVIARAAAKIQNEEWLTVICHAVFRKLVVTYLRSQGQTRIADHFEHPKTSYREIRELLASSLKRVPKGEDEISPTIRKMLEAFSEKRLKEIVPVSEPAREKALRGSRPPTTQRRGPNGLRHICSRGA